jgi:hypothetical protein
MTAVHEIAALLLRNEQSLLDPAIRRDRARLLSYLADDFNEFGSSGRIWTRSAIAELPASQDFRPPAIEDFHCRVLAPEVALVTYRTVRIDPETGERRSSLRSSVWTKREGNWRMRFHQGTPES